MKMLPPARVSAESSNCWLSGRPLLKKREKWRTLSYFLLTLKEARVIVPR
jgi:hypothetical protein